VSVIKQILLSFLIDMHPQPDTILTLTNNLHDHVVREIQGTPTGADALPVYRYAHVFGLMALKSTQLQEESEWPEKVEWIRPREAWVCSIIKDKTKKCQDSTNLPLFDEVTTTEILLNDKIFYTLKYFMDEEEFSSWDAKVKKVIPWFYLLMSI
jgi:hypothetical protein